MTKLWIVATQLVEDFFSRDMPDNILKVMLWWTDKIGLANSQSE